MFQRVSNCGRDKFEYTREIQCLCFMQELYGFGCYNKQNIYNVANSQN